MFNGRQISVWLVAIFFVTPLALLLMLSCATSWKYPHLFPETFTTAHWTGFIFHSQGLKRGFINSFAIAVTVSFVATFTGFIASKWIAYHRRKNLLLMLTYFPFALSPVIFSVCLKYYFLKTGMAGNIQGVILAQLIITFPYSVIFFTSFWNSNIKNFRALAATLGSDNWNTYRRLVFPLAKTFLLTCFFQCFIISWFEYGMTNIIGYGKVSTLTIMVFQFIGEANIYYAALCSCLLIIPPVLMLWINRKFIFYQNR